MWDALHGKFDELREFLEEIPILLRICAMACVGLGILVTLIPLLPGSSFDVSGTKLTRAQLWETRVAFAMFAVGPLMFLSGLGIFRRRGWSRIVLLIMPVLQFLPFQIVHWLFGAPNPSASLLTYAISCGVWFIVAALLVTSRSARAYYASAP
jgi:hypothetical protein